MTTKTLLKAMLIFVGLYILDIFIMFALEKLLPSGDPGFMLWHAITAIYKLGIMMILFEVSIDEKSIFRINELSLAILCYLILGFRVYPVSPVSSWSPLVIVGMMFPLILIVSSVFYFKRRKLELAKTFSFFLVCYLLVVSVNGLAKLFGVEY
jgi:hypothetical protein